MERQPMIYGNANFNFDKSALFISRAPFDLTYATSCNKFIIAGTQPTDTDRRVVFVIDDKFYKFSDAGNLIDYQYRGDFFDVIQFGNTVEELLALQNITDFVGKKIYPVIALYAKAGVPVLPKINISLEIDSYNDIYTRYYYSPVFDLTDNAKIFSLTEKDKFCNGNSTSLTECRILKLNNEWSDWMELPNAENTLGSKIQFRTNPILTTLDGSDEVKISGVICKYTTDAATSTADSFSLFTVPQKYDADLHSVYTLVNHAPLQDAELKAYVNLAEVPKLRENLSLGFGTGELQTLNLPDSYIAQDTFNITVGGKTIDDYHFDIKNRSISLTAASDAEICASYYYNYEPENWQEMTAENLGSEKTRFTYSTNDENKRVLSVRIDASRKKGSATMTPGKGSGRFQSFSIPKAATELDCNGFFNYDEVAQILKTVNPIGENINVDFDWKGALPKINGYICGAAV